MKSLILALLSLISFSVKAFGPNCFPISNDLNGTWEAVSVDYPNYPLKVFRMIITDDGESSFSYTLGRASSDFKINRARSYGRQPLTKIPQGSRTYKILNTLWQIHSNRQFYLKR